MKISQESKIKMLTETYNPSIIKFHSLTALFYVKVYNGIEKPVLTVFKGKRIKPISNYRYNNLMDMYNNWEMIKRTEQRQHENNVKFQAEKKEAKKEVAENAKVDDIYYTSWGYEQTNVDFFQIIEKAGHKITFRQLEENVIYNDSMQGTKTPVPNKFKNEKTFVRMAGLYMKGHVESSILYKWDYRPKSWSSYH